jgi:uncharacterized protein
MRKLQSLALVAFIITTSHLHAQAVQVNVSKENRTIAITCTEESSAVADIAEVEIGYSTYGSDSHQTYADAAIISNKIYKSLLDAGVQKEAIVSDNQGLKSVEADDKARLAKGLKYSFEQTWTVTVPSKYAANILQAAINAGAIYTGHINWEYSKKMILKRRRRKRL